MDKSGASSVAKSNEDIDDYPVITKSIMAANTSNPIRKMVDQMDIKPNPEKPLIPLSIGDPTIFGNLKCHETATNAIVESISCGKYNGYAPAVGYEESRQAIANYSSCKHYKLTAKDVIITSGSSSGLEHCILVLANPGDNILIPKPGFPLYKTLSDASGINVKYYDLLPDKDWEVDLTDMERAIDSRTVAILVNNPSNPCGSVFSKQHLIDILSIAEKYRLPIIADEIYSYFTFGANEFVFMASLNPNVPILSCNGLTKRFLVPGWRLGWIVIYDKKDRFKEIRTGLYDLTTRTIGANTVMQGAVPTILTQTPKEHFDSTIRVCKENLDIMIKEFAECPGIKLIEPSGAMYAMLRVELDKFPNFKNNEDFICRMVNEESVFCLPTEAFGITNYFRVLLTLPKDKTIEACQRIKLYCQRHYRA